MSNYQNQNPNWSPQLDEIIRILTKQQKTLVVIIRKIEGTSYAGNDDVSPERRLQVQKTLEPELLDAQR